MKLITSAVLGLLVSLQAAPAFAYQAHNWPGLASNKVGAYPSNVAPPSYGGSEEEMTSTGSTMAEVELTGDVEWPAGTTTLTRAEFTKLLVRSMYSDASIEKCLGRLVYSDAPDYELLFTDVSVSHSAAKEICVAMSSHYVDGYKDGSFRPEQLINVAEATKMLSIAYALTPFPVNAGKNAWYRPYIDALAARNALPAAITSLSAGMTADNLADILYRLNNAVTWRDAQTADQLQKKTDLSYIRKN